MTLLSHLEFLSVATAQYTQNELSSSALQAHQLVL